MRIYLNTTEAITDIARELKKCSSYVHTQTYQNKEISQDENFSTKEIQFFNFCILSTDDKDSMPNTHLSWLIEEFQERISPTYVNPGKAYKLRSEVWDEFLVDGKFEYSYNERIFPQLQLIIEELKRHSETRQAIIHIHDAARDTARMGKQRVPCSLSYQFMKREGKLDIIYSMRSSDFSTHFQNDIWLADELRRHLARQLNWPVGKFFMSVASLHLYKKDWDVLLNY